MANSEEDDWEYEYDENETEDFYIPIDLSNVPGSHRRNKTLPRPGAPVKLTSRLRALNEARLEAGSTALPPDDLESTPVGEIQITGLHTTNPLVMYNGQLLSCEWTSTIGTDMFFVKPDGDAHGPKKPLRSLPSVDLLAIGSAKLVARIARLRPRDELFDDEREDDPGAEPMEITTDSQSADGSTSAPNDTGRHSQSAEATQIDVQHRQPAMSNFLAKLNEAKARKGERSRLALSKTDSGSRLVVEEGTTQAAHTNEEADDTIMGGTR